MSSRISKEKLKDTIRTVQAVLRDTTLHLKDLRIQLRHQKIKLSGSAGDKSLDRFDNIDGDRLEKLKHKREEPPAPPSLKVNKASRIFGGLLSHLKDAQKQGENEKELEIKRRDIEVKAQEKMVSQDRTAFEIYISSIEKEIEMEESNRKFLIDKIDFYEKKLWEFVWKEHHNSVSQFSVTKTEPHVYYCTRSFVPHPVPEVQLSPPTSSSSSSLASSDDSFVNFNPQTIPFPQWRSDLKNGSNTNLWARAVKGELEKDRKKKRSEEEEKKKEWEKTKEGWKQNKAKEAKIGSEKEKEKQTAGEEEEKAKAQEEKEREEERENEAALGETKNEGVPEEEAEDETKNNEKENEDVAEAGDDRGVKKGRFEEEDEEEGDD